MKLQNKNGFTLVELSIVLVIIGLIVGGVVGGQSLVYSARLQSVVKDFKKYQTAIRAFELQYDAVPGDMADAEDYWGSVSNCGSTNPGAGTGTQTCDGDGDGAIDYYQVSSVLTDSPLEQWRAWEHLQNAGILPGSLTGIATDGDLAHAVNVGNVPGLNVPEGAVKGSLFFLNGSTSKPSMVFGSFEGAAPFKWYNTVLSPMDARAVDKKMDDGVALTGKLIGAGSNADGDVCRNAATDKYELSHSKVACRLTFTY
jgi:prepilin-type N-terminal cleavage/methylation domain-containing protein